jgi:hypothetical protein
MSERVYPRRDKPGGSPNLSTMPASARIVLY